MATCVHQMSEAPESTGPPCSYGCSGTPYGGAVLGITPSNPPSSNCFAQCKKQMSRRKKHGHGTKLSWHRTVTVKVNHRRRRNRHPIDAGTTDNRLLQPAKATNHGAKVGAAARDHTLIDFVTCPAISTTPRSSMAPVSPTLTT